MSASPTSPSSRKRQQAATSLQPQSTSPVPSTATQNISAASVSSEVTKAPPAASPTAINTDAANRSSETVAKSPHPPSSGRKRKAAEISMTPASEQINAAGEDSAAPGIGMASVQPSPSAGKNVANTAVGNATGPALVPEAAAPQPTPPAKKSRTNTPWTPAEERKLKTLRDAGSSWSEIAKEFPHRTEGSVKKHWYKDMHYADFAEDESAALLAAIREYEANKWKEIGKKVGKPAKACEQYAKEHFSGKL